MSKVLFTMAEEVEQSTKDTFALKYSVDEHDCLHFAHSLKATGHEVYFANWKDLQIGTGSATKFDRMFSYNENRYVEPVALNLFDLIFVYKMEGFYKDPNRFNEMLSAFAHTRVMNDPRTIRHNFNKSYLWELQDKSIRIIPSFKIAEIKDKISEEEKFVIKPLCGERGNEIFLAQSKSDLARIAGLESSYMAQQFMPEIWQGERSLVFLGHQFQHAVIKKPKQDAGEFRCNESLGGTVAVYEPTDEEIAFAANVIAAYEQLGYPSHFSRIDIIEVEGAPMLLEAELLNPSMYANYSNKGAAFGEKLGAYFDNFMTVKELSL